MDVEALTRKASKLNEVIENQRTTTDEAFRVAKRVYAREARKVWVDHYIPELVAHMDRLLEIKDIYRKLKGSEPLNPSYPYPLEAALGKNDLWLKKRKEEWFAQT